MPHPLLVGLGKLSTVAGYAAGAGIAVSGVDYLAEKLMPAKYPAVSGFLDSITNVLDPMDFSGTRARKEAAQKKREKKAKSKAAKESKKRKQAESKAAEAEAKAATQESEAAAAIQRANEAEARAQSAEQRAAAAEKRATAVKKSRWAAMARHTASQARAQSKDNPDLANQLAQAAVEIVKNATKPPAGPQDILASGQFTPQAMSFMVSMMDEINRRGSEPNYEDLVQRMVRGDSDAYEEMGEAAFDLDGPDHPTHDPRKMPLSLSVHVEGIVSGACCSSCNSGGSCAGDLDGPEDSLIDGSINGDWVGSDDDDGYATAVMGGDFFDDDAVSGGDDSFFLPTWSPFGYS